MYTCNAHIFPVQHPTISIAHRHTSTQPQHTTQVDDNNTISPTLSLKKGYLTYTWTHLLGDGAKLETTIDPFNVRGIYVGLCMCTPPVGGWVDVYMPPKEICMCIYRGETTLDPQSSIPSLTPPHPHPPTAKPKQDLDVTWSDPGKGGEWVTRANIPLKEPKTATLSFKRKFTFQ